MVMGRNKLVSEALSTSRTSRITKGWGSGPDRFRYAALFEYGSQAPGNNSSLLSMHLLVVEVWRFADPAYYAPVPRAERLCRMCTDEMEIPEHALITYNALDAQWINHILRFSYSQTHYSGNSIYHRPRIALLA
jgi:hypothetical protein